MNLIIVDDHILFREGLASIIRSESDMTICGMAGSVKEAVELVRTVKPDIVLMDFSLPDGTGVDATRLILENQPGCKIVFLTMSEEDENLLDAIRSGAKGYLLKNMQPRELIAALRSVQMGEGALSRSMTLRLMNAFSQTKKSITPKDATLTMREIDVLRLVATGFSNAEIADQLFISENTVKYHVHSILKKLGVDSRRDLTAYARARGLVKD